MESLEAVKAKIHELDQDVRLLRKTLDEKCCENVPRLTRKFYWTFTILITAVVLFQVFNLFLTSRLVDGMSLISNFYAQNEFYEIAQ